MSFKIRSSEKVPYWKSSCSRLIFCNHLIKYSFFVSLWAMIKTEERALTASPWLAVVNLTSTYFINRYLHRNKRMGIAANSSILPSRWALCLTDFYFHRKVCKQKNVWRNLTRSQFLRRVVKVGTTPGKTLIVIVTWLLWCQILILEGCLLSFKLCN